MRSTVEPCIQMCPFPRAITVRGHRHSLMVMPSVGTAWFLRKYQVGKLCGTHSVGESSSWVPTLTSHLRPGLPRFCKFSALIHPSSGPHERRCFTSSYPYSIPRLSLRSLDLQRPAIFPGQSSYVADETLHKDNLGNGLWRKQTTWLEDTTPDASARLLGWVGVCQTGSFQPQEGLISSHASIISQLLGKQGPTYMSFCLHVFTLSFSFRSCLPIYPPTSNKTLILKSKHRKALSDSVPPQLQSRVFASFSERSWKSGLHALLLGPPPPQKSSASNLNHHCSSNIVFSVNK